MQWTLEPDLKRTLGAVDLMRKAAALNPDQERIWLTLNRALHEVGLADAAQACIRDGLERLPHSALLHAALARELLDERRFEECHAEVCAALKLSSRNELARIVHFEFLVATMQREELEKVIDGIDALAPSHPRLLQAWDRLRPPKNLLERCESMLARNPAHTGARYFKALALAKLGRHSDARDAMAIANLIDIRDLPTPPGYESAQAFREALAAEIRRNPTLRADPYGKATRDGQQTRFLRQPDADAIAALHRAIRTSVEDYERRIADLADGFVAARPTRATLRSWAVIYGSDGRQASHFHPAGWLSGVFYVTAPRPLGANAYRGDLVLGALDETAYGGEPPWETQNVEPVPGRLVLFPSFLPHATEATGIPGARISIAFDIVPDAPAGPP